MRTAECSTKAFVSGQYSVVFFIITLFAFAVGVSLMLTIASNFAFLLLLVCIVLVGFNLLVDSAWDLLIEERSMRYCDRLHSFGC